MADRIKILVQKRTSLKSQITNLSNALDKSNLDNTALRLRITRLTHLYNAYEEYNDELAVLDPNDSHHDEFTNIQERFYNLTSKIETFLNTANTSTSGISNDETQSDRIESSVSTKSRRLKLPFFRHLYPLLMAVTKTGCYLKTFSNMVGSRTDLSDVDKLHYLKATLVGEAANKTKIFAIDGINYSKAWELLERSYKVKKILISLHLSLIINADALVKETSTGLSKLANDNTWEATLGRNEFPKLDQLYKFLYKSAVCQNANEQGLQMQVKR
ncbi:hypothetical protein ALC60_05833 [Trachymyrmex zeteki]|uniref:Uncharacterized protein n=1 Tax=Mycetomoellerius zeteki TaxID=64791 RepID=A0A151X4Q1_9HYME|nr:hypothetical protein ALC60_05833 [Trachymyrmex zeteki]